MTASPFEDAWVGTLCLRMALFAAVEAIHSFPRLAWLGALASKVALTTAVAARVVSLSSISTKAAITEVTTTGMGVLVVVPVTTATVISTSSPVSTRGSSTPSSPIASGSIVTIGFPTHGWELTGLEYLKDDMSVQWSKNRERRM
ncbi:hypothetical protein BJX64DRAFT_253995 [Aspergillus heterothallicus]